MPSHRNVWDGELRRPRGSLLPHHGRLPPHAPGAPAAAYRRAITDPRAVGAYNVAANPVLDLAPCDRDQVRAHVVTGAPRGELQESRLRDAARRSGGPR